MAFATNILILVLTVGSIEILVRIFSTRTAAGETIRGVLLHPRKWSDVVALYKPVIARMNHDNSVLIYDPTLGWTVASSHQNATRQDASSAEGLRAPRVGMSFTDRRTRHSGLPEKPATVRGALMGDSMTYGPEVRCEESWGHALEAHLGSAVQILNFGVSGYGLNQVFLRYEKDAQLWKLQIVLIGITSEEIRRIMNVYNFLMNPDWLGLPFIRPRLILEHGIPTPINHSCRLQRKFLLTQRSRIYPSWIKTPTFTALNGNATAYGVFLRSPISFACYSLSDPLATLLRSGPLRNP